MSKDIVICEDHTNAVDDVIIYAVDRAEECVLCKLQAENAKLNREYIKVWEVLRTYNPSDIELKYIGFEDVK
jgi:hypothetical protein